MFNSKNIILLGATGSIGKSTLNLLRNNRDKFNLIGVSAHNNVSLLSNIVNEFDVPHVVLSNSLNVKDYFGKSELSVGTKALIDLAQIECDIVVTGIIGISGLYSAFAAIDAGNNLAIANKEKLVTAGKIFVDKSIEKKCNLLPVDSEHNAIFQCLDDSNFHNLDFITLTSSGGPFLNKNIKEFKNIKPENALKHPIWNMGKKISIDSSTMINKALEIIEASVLFGLSAEKIEVIVHPEHIIHGLVHYNDGSIIANMGLPDMITPISVALNWPDRLNLNLKKLSLSSIGKLTFLEPDLKKFPGLKFGWDCLSNPKSSPIVFNGSNEVTVDYFLKGKIKFTDIYYIIEKTLNNYDPVNPKNIDDVVEIDKITRMKSLDVIKGM
jgi:1-deoxy-D-xylulose-5-phosphate reductoisomerase